MNKKQKLFWVILSYILLMAVVCIINIDAGLVMLFTTLGILITIMIILFLYVIYMILNDDDMYWY